MDKVELGSHGRHCQHIGKHAHSGQCEHGGQQIQGEYAEDFWFLEVASRHFRMDNVYFVGMVDMMDKMDMVDNIDMVDNMNTVDIIDMENM